MSVFTSRPALRWLVPTAVVVAVIGGGAAVRSISASAEPALPERSAAQLLVDLQTARLDGLSGTVTTRADLGLPSLPNPGGQGSADLTTLVSGSHTLRVWYAGPDKARVALLGTLGESDVIRNGSEVWFWNSRDQTAEHQKLTGEQQQEQKTHAPPSLVPRSPQEAADLALRQIDPTTVVRTGNTARVAGRPAYELILGPKDTASLIGEVRLAIDATEHVPLRVQVFARGGGEPAYEVKFTQVSFARPDDSQFRFNPPPGTSVKEAPADAAPGPDRGSAKPEQAPDSTRIVGTGWTSVVVMKASASDAATKPGTAATPEGQRGAAGLFDSLPKVNGSWGSGRLLTGKLFSALFTDDGRVLAGAVAPERLYEAARG
jgi:outer membrane lipoprotein-sorting protein